MRITINLNPGILERVDQEAQRLGTSRGAMLTTWIGEKVNALETTRLWMEKLTQEQTINELTQKAIDLQKELDEVQPNLFDADDLDGGGEAG